MTHALEIETARLRLVALSPETLEQLLSREDGDTPRHQGLAFESDFFETVNDLFLTIHLNGLRRHPSSPGWFVRAIVRRDDERVIGHCGFHGVPQDVGRAEIGYTIFAPFRRQGFGAESARGLVEWSREQGWPVVVATVAPANAASVGLLRQLGFRQSGVQQNAAGADEWVFEFSPD
ncbi:MAG TPA: GNAT family N-acetyltransferase [Acidimicrobiales bacterium]|nr:GNAT family N-acetyltransferase [Acidimicrobiales bacterium]